LPLQCAVHRGLHGVAQTSLRVVTVMVWLCK
jgi:hypothetical protein